ncbi:hypothetical protein B0A54_12208 [Friedmanniomyces endolithicus]|uniref:Transcription factor domain-containing protein n=1 Tax=Friedmanniomyces endolithicus TaxID=329885 RepID=A0A4U0UK32_9PEZI|nr:hypothetical protein LTS09_014403 [Friedmanniomyces endolithicus]TKA35984.1 hypothetical protein B0A54_12208 [Friedmanniomyces endolithicus]
MNATVQGAASLKSFYGYRETFAKSTTWVDVPQKLTFVYTNNPYEDEERVEGGGRNDDRNVTRGDDDFAARLTAVANNAAMYGEEHRAHEWEASQSLSYPAYATQGLEALSAAVASRDPYDYIPPSLPAVQTEGPYSTSMMSPGLQIHPTSAQPHNNLDFILNHSSAEPTPGDGNVDPQLHSEASLDIEQPLLQDQHQHQWSPTDVRPPSYLRAFGRPRSRSKGSTLPRRVSSIEDPELAYLMRDFTERAGLWMDLFDLGLFFSTTVPVLAVRCPLLLYSCVALSAKSLARVNGRKPVIGGQVTPSRQSRMEMWTGAARDGEDWIRRAREFYDRAVTLLRQALDGATGAVASPLRENVSLNTMAATQGLPLPTTDSDELVAATAILCVYEFLDASGQAWTSHLDGAKSLFDIAKDSMVPLTLPPSPVSIAQQVTERLSDLSDADRPRLQRGLSQGRRAVFWNFARQDMLSAFINNTSTRLDTADLPMWRSAGLKLTLEGFVCPSNPQHPDYTPENTMPDDLISNALVWLLQKLVNFIAAGDDVPEALSPQGLGIRQQELLAYWKSLDEQFRIWHEGLPLSFHATAVRCPTPDPEDPRPSVEEKWFPRPMCASTMQSYHFAQVQLLHNKPHLSTSHPIPIPSPRPHHPPHQSPARPLTTASAGSSLAARHASYATILQRSRGHAREIVAIGLGRADEGARIHAVQALWTAGLVLGVAGADEERGIGGEVGVEVEVGVGMEPEGWRRRIVGLLSGIERDVGWASGYRVRSLLELWGLPGDWGGGGVESEELDREGGGGRQYDALGI